MRAIRVELLDTDTVATVIAKHMRHLSPQHKKDAASLTEQIARSVHVRDHLDDVFFELGDEEREKIGAEIGNVLGADFSETAPPNYHH